MKKIFPLLMIATGLFFQSCGDATNPEKEGGKSMNEAAPEMGPADRMFEEVMNYHDEAMPKISKLKGYQTQAQTKIDSLSALKDPASKQLKTQLEQLLAELQRAEKGMMDWMDGFNPEPEVENEEALLQYYEAEKTKAKAMRDDIFNALDSAAALLGS